MTFSIFPARYCPHVLGAHKGMQTAKPLPLCKIVLIGTITYKDKKHIKPPSFSRLLYALNVNIKVPSWYSERIHKPSCEVRQQKGQRFSLHALHSALSGGIKIAVDFIHIIPCLHCFVNIWKCHKM